MLSKHQQKYLAWELSRKKSSSDDDKFTSVLSEAQVDLNPHQVQGALFAFRSPFSKGCVLASEVGLGKTIEAAIVISQHWAERKRNILVIAPATLRKQWSSELDEKFFLPSIILEKKNFDAILNKTYSNPFEQKGRIVIVSYQFAIKQAQHIARVNWDLVVIDEAHKLRNVYKNTIGARTIKDTLQPFKKVLLTATPLQNNIQELYGLVSVIDDNYFGSLDSFENQYSKVSLRNDFVYEELRERIKPIIHRTLRKNVQEYVKYTERIPFVQEYYPTEDEQLLYKLITTYLQKDQAYGLPERQRSLITMILRKLLASSSFAVANTLKSIIERLESYIKEIERNDCDVDEYELDGIANDIDDFDEDFEEFDEEDDKRKKELTRDDLDGLKKEIDELNSYLQLALSIASNSKGECLFKALEVGFDKMKEMGANQKALIFTESTRTQRYLFELLESRGYKDKVVLFNGSNSDPLSKKIYNNWLAINQNTQKITSSVSANKRQALVDFFRNDAQIMIATEAAAEGINLQFCSLLINYDLPWNPQRVEQRIGRCHRYGQKNDVVVINFLNKANAADVRVYELLDKKFKLFSGVFGSSDEVLGAIESGVDFEKKMLEIYQKCRTENEINVAFDSLRSELEDIIEENLTQTRTSLLENFDQEVIEKLRMREKNDAYRLDKYQNQLWSLTKESLEEYISIIDDEKHLFRLNNTPLGVESPIGNYCLTREQGTYYNYRISHPLAKWVVNNAKTLATGQQRIVFNYSEHPYKISLFENENIKRGYLYATLLSFEALTDTEEHILLVAMDDKFNLLDEDIATRLLSIPIIEENSSFIPSEVQDLLSQSYSKKRLDLVNELELRNNDIMTEEIIKIEKWAEDNRKQHEGVLNKIDDEIEVKNKLFIQERTMKRKLQIQKEKQQLDEKREVAWKEYDSKKREISEQKNKLIDRLSELADSSVNEVDSFMIEWIIK